MGVRVQEGMGVTIPGAAAAAGAHRLGHAAGTQPLLTAAPQTVDVLIGELAALAAVRVLETRVRVVVEMVIGVRVAEVQGGLVSVRL